MKSALVTGGGQGIGAVIVKKLLSHGYKVAALDIDGRGLAKLKAKVPEVVTFEADTTQEGAIEEVLVEFGHTPDLVVNNAGIVRFGSLLETSARDFSKVINVNLNGYFTVARSAAKLMVKKNSGVIINITSINGVMPAPYAGAYGAAKAGVALLTQQMALEWGPFGVRVNAIAPGLIDAGMSTPIYSNPKFRRLREEKVPLGRLGTAEDIAATVLYLASPEASYITGQNIVVDGGVSMGMIGQLPRPEAVDGLGDSGRIS